jgi:hypothetical protein
LLEAGHAAARRYSLATVWTEAEIIRHRQAGRKKLDAVVMQMCMAAVISEKGGKQLEKFIATLNVCD